MAEFYRVVRVRPNGAEQIARDIAYADVSEEQLRRAETFADAATRRDLGQHIRVYSSSGEQVTPDDLIWDSRVNT